jgi:hypothetical protein
MDSSKEVRGGKNRHVGGINIIDSHPLNTVTEMNAVLEEKYAIVFHQYTV